MVSMGYNYRLTEVAAALGISQLKKLDRFVATRNKIANYFNERFKNEKLFLTQNIKPNTTTSRHLYPIILNPELQGLQRRNFYPTATKRFRRASALQTNLPKFFLQRKIWKVFTAYCK